MKIFLFVILSISTVAYAGQEGGGGGVEKSNDKKSEIAIGQEGGGGELN